MVERDEGPAQDPFSPSREAMADDQGLGPDGGASDESDESDSGSGDEPKVNKLQSIANVPPPPPKVKTFGMKQNPSGVPSTGATTSWREDEAEFEQGAPAAEAAPSEESNEKLAELEKSLAEARATVEELKAALSQVEEQDSDGHHHRQQRRPGRAAGASPQRHRNCHQRAPGWNARVRRPEELRLQQLSVPRHRGGPSQVYQVRWGQLDGLVPVGRGRGLGGSPAAPATGQPDGYPELRLRPGSASA